MRDRRRRCRRSTSSQLCGYYEIRAKNSLTAHHIAYWLLEAKAGGGEIDVTEDKGWGGPNYPSMPGVRHVYTHYDDVTTHEERCATFHLYAIEIYEGGLRIYHDNDINGTLPRFFQSSPQATRFFLACTRMASRTESRT